MKTKIIIFAILMFGFAAASFAQSMTPVVTQSQLKQQKRIRKGVNEGEITRAEFQQVQHQQRHINRSKKAAKSDGVVTPAERKVLNRKQKKASANIYHKKHNKRDRN